MTKIKETPTLPMEKTNPDKYQKEYVKGFEREDSEFTKTPYFESRIFELLPEPLNKLCALFEGRQRDIFLLSALGFISGVLPKCYFLHDNKKYYPNFLGAIVAPSGSGKGHAGKAKNLISKIESFQREQNKVCEREYKERLRNKEAVESPMYQHLLLPADSSSKSVKMLLETNEDNTAIIYESEIDTLVNVGRNEWGAWDDLLRKAAEHEIISYNRSGDGYGTIEEPRISAILCGTPQQFQNLIPSVENGLYSRFSTYFFISTPIWNKNVFISSNKSETRFNELFENASNVVFDLWQYQQSSHETNFTYRSDEAYRLNEFFSGWLDRNYKINAELSSDVARGAVNFRRINLILSILRIWNEKGSLPKNITTTKDDFDSALSIIDTLLTHSVRLYHSLPKSSGIKARKSLQIFYDALPIDTLFTTDEALAIASNIEISERSAKRHLPNLVDLGHLIKPKHGHFMKLKNK